MNTIFEIDFEKLNISDESIIFFDLVLTQNSKPILKTNKNFNKVFLFDKDNEIPSEMMKLSMSPTVARYDSKQPISFHIYKVKKTTAIKLGYKRHIEANTSKDQNVAEFVAKTPSELKKAPFIYNVEITKSDNKFIKVNALTLNETLFASDMWLTQREFYSTSHLTVTNEIQAMDYNIIWQFIEENKNKKFKDVLAVLIAFGSSVLDKVFQYENDMDFKRNKKLGDAGDVAVELSGEGDCEDFSHFYMRNFRLLATSPFDVGDGDLKKRLQELRDNYIPFSFICEVDIGTIQFHSTMLILSKSNQLSNISFEVTCPSKSYNLDSEYSEFDDWHENNYFLLDNYWYTRFDKEHSPRSKFGEFKFINY